MIMSSKRKAKKGFLTDKQIIVLKLIKQGYSKVEISRILKTSRANISYLEKSALENIRKAKETLEIAKFIEAPVWIRGEAGENLNDFISRIYVEAGKKKIHVRYTRPELITEIEKRFKNEIKGMVLKKDIEIGITEKGDIAYVL